MYGYADAAAVVTSVVPDNPGDEDAAGGTTGDVEFECSAAAVLKPMGLPSAVVADDASPAVAAVEDVRPVVRLPQPAKPLVAFAAQLL